MATIDQMATKYEDFQQSINNGEIAYLQLTKGKGQNQSTKIFEIDRLLQDVVAGVNNFQIKDIEKAISLYHSGAFTLGGHDETGRMVHKYSFDVTKIQDQRQREELANIYGLDPNATIATVNRQNPNNQNNNGNGNGNYSSIFGNNGNNNNQNNQQQQMAALQQLLGLRQPQQQNNDIFGMLNSALAPQQVNQSLQYYKQEIENIVKELKREFENTKILHNNEILQYKQEQINRNAEHKKELADLSSKYENQIRDMQNRFDNMIKDMNRDHEAKLDKLETNFDRRLSDLSNNQKLEMMTIKNETSNSKPNSFLETWLTLTHQEKMETAKQLSDSKNQVDQSTAKMMELYLQSQNNNPMTDFVKIVLTNQINQKTTDPNLKSIKEMAELLNTLKGDSEEKSSKWDKLLEYGGPMIAKVGEGLVQGFMNKGKTGNIMSQTTPYVPQPQYPQAPTVQPQTYTPMPVTTQTNVTPFPKSNPIQTATPVQTPTPVVNTKPEINPQEIKTEVNYDDNIPDEVPDLMKLQEEFNNPEVQQFLTTKISPIFIQDSPELIADQLFDSFIDLNDSKICPEIMKVIHSIEDALYDKDYDYAFNVISLITNSIGIEMTPEHIQQTRNIFECYSKILIDLDNEKEEIQQ